MEKDFEKLEISLEDIENLENLPLDNQLLGYREQKPDTKDDLVRKWEDKLFKSKVKQYLKKTYNYDKKVGNKLAYKVWKEMFEKNVKNSYRIPDYEKVLYHPELTHADNNYISQKIQNRFYVVLQGQIILMGLLFIAYRKSNRFQSLKENLSIGIPILGSMPMLTMGFTWYGYTYFLNRQFEKIGIYKQYGIN